MVNNEKIINSEIDNYVNNLSKLTKFDSDTAKLAK